MPLLSVVIACYNEVTTLEGNFRQLLLIQNASLPIEIIFVDDGSTDNSLVIAQTMAASHPIIKIFTHSKNLGKGAALRTGFSQAQGDYLVIHDADMEYDPQDLLRLFRLLQQGQGDVAIGSRFTGRNKFPASLLFHRLANWGLTNFFNICTGLRISDMECCYKMFHRDYLSVLQLQEPRFGIEPELVAKLSKIRVNNMPLRFVETDVYYHPRSYAQGKKIGIADGFSALRCIIRYGFGKPILLTMHKDDQQKAA